MKASTIAINCDVGEGSSKEPSFFPYISSCSIACGGHIGTSETMRKTVLLAKKYGVKIGAHPSYPDKANFGRVSMHLSAKELRQTVQNQIEALLSIMDNEEVSLHHIKPHGALYNDIAKNELLAQIFLESIEKYKDAVFLYVPFASIIEKMALEQGFRTKREAFADRNYRSNLSLVARNEPNALIEKPEAVWKHILSIKKNNRVRTITGEYVEIYADTYCIHGDTSSALQILMYLSQRFPER